MTDLTEKVAVTQEVLKFLTLAVCFLLPSAIVCAVCGVAHTVGAFLGWGL